jgi:hypothetical protein
VPDATISLEQKLYSAPRYVSDDAVLRLTVYNAAAGVTVRLSGRRLDALGRNVPFVDRLVPSTNRTASTFDKPLDEGWLIGVTASIAAGAPLDGQTYGVFSIGRGQGTAFEELDVLAAGTITAAKRIAFPGSPIVGPIDGPGALRSVSGTQPAAGAEVTETVPTGARWELLMIGLPLTTSATAANRIPAIIFDDGTNYLLQTVSVFQQAASLTVTHSFAQGFNFTGTVLSQIIGNALPANNRLPAGARFRSSTTNLQVGDQYGVPHYLVREWIEGA